MAGLVKIGSGKDTSGDVVGPGSATDGAVAKYDGKTGKLLKDGVVLGTAAAKDAAAAGTKGGVLNADDATTTNARTPSVHAASHKTAGGDALAPGDIGALASPLAFFTTHTWPLPDSIAVPSGDTNYIQPMKLSISSDDTVVLAKVHYRCNNGDGSTDFTFSVNLNGSGATGFTALKTSANTNWSTTAPKAVALADGDVIVPVVSAIDGTPKNGSISVQLQHTVA